MNRLIAVIGPTAVGKTKISIDLARKLDTEIISGDSMLVYRECDIGTAKPTLEEQRGIVHHLVDILEPDQEYSVADFQTQAADLIEQLNAQGRIPILAGGTGLYVKALLEGYQFNSVGGDPVIRDYLLLLAAWHGNAFLHQCLAQVDPAAAGRLHPNDQKRIVRALEVYYLSGESVSQAKRPPTELRYDAVVIGLVMDRATLYERINRRVDIMIEQGLVNEVRGLLDAGISPEAQAMQGIGYKEIVEYLEGKTDLSAAISRIKQATRHFAKRQLTWYRSMPYIDWVQVDQFDNYNILLENIYRRIAGTFFPKYNK